MQIYKNWLHSNGFRYEEETYGLVFRYKDCTFIIGNNDNDKEYLYLLMPGIYDVEDDLMKVYKAMNTINSDRKCVKATLHDNTVSLDVEMLIDSTPDIEDFMDRLLNMLLQARVLFYEELR